MKGGHFGRLFSWNAIPYIMLLWFGLLHKKSGFPVEESRFYLIIKRLFLREIGFVYAADRAGPIERKIFKGGAGGDAVVGITDFGIIHITAHVTYVFFHNLMIF